MREAATDISRPGDIPYMRPTMQKHYIATKTGIRGGGYVRSRN
jgi:hypothetical protein